MDSQINELRGGLAETNRRLDVLAADQADTRQRLSGVATQTSAVERTLGVVVAPEPLPPNLNGEWERLPSKRILLGNSPEPCSLLEYTNVFTAVAGEVGVDPSMFRLSLEGVDDDAQSSRRFLVAFHGSDRLSELRKNKVFEQ